MNLPKPMPPLTVEQNEIITGSMLGDGGVYGGIHYQNRTPLFQKEQSLPHEDYLFWMLGKMKPYSLNKLGKYKSRSFMFRTHAALSFIEWRNKWYKGRNKIVPQDLELTPLALAIWYIDDGCNNVEHRRIQLATCCFTEKENEFLIDKLKITFDINSYLVRGKYPVIYSSGYESYLRFIEIVKPYIVWDSFKYKIDLSKYVEPIIQKTGMNHSWAKYSDATVQEVLKLHKNGLTSKQIREITGVSWDQQKRYRDGKRLQVVDQNYI